MTIVFNMKNNLFIMLCVMMAFSVDTLAGTGTRSAKITGSAITQGAIVEVRDELYDYMLTTPQAQWNFDDQKVENHIRLRFTSSDKKYYNQAWTVQVNVNIKIYSNQGLQVGNTINKNLSVNYEPASGLTYNDINTYVTTGGYYATVEVASTSLTSSLAGVMPADIMLENELEIERYYRFGPNVNVNLGITGTANSTDNTILFKWGFVEGAEEYDLEWLYVYNNSVTSYNNGVTGPSVSVPVNWKNATRVSTSNTFYKINAAFDDGDIYFRVRGVGRFGPSFVYRLDGNWQYNGSGNGTPLTVRSTSFPLSDFRDKARNWTYSAVYAEEGKRKEVGSFFDGSTHNRQSVTLNNSNNVALVQEQYYDYEGRNAAQSLPAASVDNSTSPAKYDAKLKFYPAFNLVATNTLYSKKNFDNTLSGCTGVCAMLDAVNANNKGGAAYYYSSSNTAAKTFGFNDYIPDAGDVSVSNSGKYPFTHTKYNLENKATSISGVGAFHKTGSGHETKVYDVNASQEKLDRLFGNEVGYANHYREKAVIDANGQVSVSYIDLSGKVIATAMRGENPANLVLLNSTDEPYMSPETIKENFTSLNEYDPSSQCNTISKKLLVTNTSATYAFVYEVTPQKMNDICPGTDHNCRYLLSIKITDECGASVYTYTQSLTYTGAMQSHSFNQVFSSIGVYNIEKKLCLDPQNVKEEYNTYVTAISTPGTCITYTAAQTPDMDECKTCEQYATTLTEQYYTDNQLTLPQDPSTDTQYQGIYSIFFRNNCIETPKHDCSTLLDRIKTDVSPGGQYFEYVMPGTTSSNPLGTDYVVGSGPGSYSITQTPGLPWPDAIGFINSNANPSTTVNSTNYTASSAITAFNNALQTYTASSVNCANIVGTPLPTGGSYNSLADALKANWNDEYAEFLARFHPEYCRYVRCMNLECSKSYDYLLEALDYNTAIITANTGLAASGGNQIQDNNNDPNTTTGGGSSVLAQDPFFNAFSSLCSASNCPSTGLLSGYGGTYDQNGWQSGDANFNSALLLKTLMQNEINNCQYCESMYSRPAFMAAPFNLAGGCVLDPVNNNYAMWDYAAYIPSLAGTCNGTTFTPDKKKQWENFKVLYLTYKNFLIANYYKSGFDFGCNIPLSDRTNPPDLVTDGYGTGNYGAAFGPGYSNQFQLMYCNNMLILDADPGFQTSTGGSMSIPHIVLATQVQPTPPANMGAGSAAGCLQPGQITLNYDQINNFKTATGAASANFNFDCNQATNYDKVTLYVVDVPGGPSPITITNSNVPVNIAKIPAMDCSVNALNGNLPPADQIKFLKLIADDINAKYNGVTTPPYFNAMVDPQNLTLIIKPDATTAAAITQAYQSGTTPTVLAINKQVNTSNETSNNMLFAPVYNACLNKHCFCDYLDELRTVYDNDVSLQGVSFETYAAAQINATFDPTSTGNNTYSTYSATQITYWYGNCTSYNHIYPVDADDNVTVPATNTTNHLNGVICPDDDLACQQEGVDEANYEAQTAFNNSIQVAAQAFLNTYVSACFTNINESFRVTYDEREYHYTLYYYDQAGNLVRTVPPKGVYRILNTSLYSGNTNLVNQARVSGTGFLYPGHSIDTQTGGTVLGSANNGHVTNYQYSTLNQVVKQTTPDAGDTRFWYDILGRLRFSQNSKQLALGGTCGTCYGFYSYTLYDAQSRIIEVGESDQQATACVLSTEDPSSQRYSSPGNIPTGNPSVSCPSGYTSSTVPFYWQVDLPGFPTQNAKQVTKTYYDVALFGNTYQSQFSLDGITGQKVLRKRVVTSSFEENEDNSDLTYDHASHYSYDIHGNVQELVQENTMLTAVGQQFKNVKYRYDLLSGKVNEVHYQDELVDEFHHKYYYDADNRLTNAYSSSDEIHWDQDAKYFYYPHGPLARVELGDEKVQGMDYAYTLQGWIKGVNNNTLDAQKDMGLDGLTPTGRDYMPIATQPKVHQNVAYDAMGYVLDYFNKDYSAINSLGSNFTGNITASAFYALPNRDLYNGNIKGLSESIAYPGTITRNMARIFKYDQLNRILNAEAYFLAGTDYSSITSAHGTPSASDYYESFTYDPNGNIKSAARNAYVNGGGNNLDGLTYNYQAGSNNKLDYVSDGNDNSSFTTDIKAGQTAGNYDYDFIGNLRADVKEQIDLIEWSVYGKIKSITRVSGCSTKVDLAFHYDAQGNRVCKIEKPRPGGNASQQQAWKYTFYIRDAQGNVLSVIERDYTSITGGYSENINLKEHDIYGSSRHALCNRNLLLKSATFSSPTYNPDLSFATVSNYTPIQPTYNTNSLYRALGNKSFELANHLGNVLAVVSDRKIQESGSGTDVGGNGVADYYTAEVQTAENYYSFGMAMPGRKYTSGIYRYGFNNQEKETEINESVVRFEFRQYDTRLGRFFSIDPLTKKYPELTPYQFASNTPIWATDLEGLEANYTSIPTNQPFGGETVPAGTKTSIYGPRSDVYLEENNLLEGSSKVSSVGKSASVDIVPGSKPAKNASDQHNYKISGGIAGGHALINTSDGIFGFSNSGRNHWFAKKGDKMNSKYDVYQSDEFNEMLEHQGKRLVSFKLDLTLDQYQVIMEKYSVGTLSVGSALFPLPATPKIDYSIFGWRCANTCLKTLTDIGVLKSNGMADKYIHAITPNALIRYLEDKGFEKLIVKPGTTERIWNNAGK